MGGGANRESQDGIVSSVSELIMARYWVGVDTNWHDGNNWSTSSGGAGGAGIPDSTQDTYFDGNGFAVCQANSSIATNNLTLTGAATETVIVGASGVIHGDFSIAAGYFGPTGGPNFTIEFKGNWLNTGGTFAVGTGSGKDPECIFSGTSKTYTNNNTSAASFQNVLVSGSLTMSGTRLVIMNISQKLSVTGTMTVNKNGTTICRVDLSGANAGFDTFSGTLDGTGRLWWVFQDGDSVPTTGTINIDYFRFDLTTGYASGPIDTDLIVDGWTNVNSDWTHTGTEPWIDSDDADTSIISAQSVSTAVGDYDEYYSMQDVVGDYEDISLTKCKIHLKGRLAEGVGGAATLVQVRGYLWDGTTWQDAGLATFVSTSYTDTECLTSLHASFDTLAKVNNMRMKVEVATVIGGGADKGEINITQAWVEIEGTVYWNPIFDIAARAWGNDCTVEFEYTDDDQTIQLLSGDRHYFNGGVQIYCDVVSTITSTFDCDTSTAEMWVRGEFGIDDNAFPDATVNIKFGDGVHVFRGNVDFFFSYSSTTSVLNVDAGEGTLILWPTGRQIFIPAP